MESYKEVTLIVCKEKKCRQPHTYQTGHHCLDCEKGYSYIKDTLISEELLNRDNILTYENDEKLKAEARRKKRHGIRKNN